MNYNLALDHTLCTICGIPISSISHSEGPHGYSTPVAWDEFAWQEGAAVYCGPQTTRDGFDLTKWNRILTRHVADHDSDDKRLLVNREIIRPQDSFEDTFDIPIHFSCESLASHVMSCSTNAGLLSFADLWLTIERRCKRSIAKEIGSDPFHLDFGPCSQYLPGLPCNAPGEPFRFGLDRYFFPYDEFRGQFEPYADDPEYEDIWVELSYVPVSLPLLIIEWKWEIDPMYIPSLTICLLANLKPCKCTGRRFTQFSSAFEALPRETKNQVLEDMRSQTLGAKTNFLIAQSYWKEMLCQIPFLWDLDMDLIDAKARYPSSAACGEWDWETLTRQVMTPMIVLKEDLYRKGLESGGYKQAGLIIPPGLQNRRRIWQILEEMHPEELAESH